MNPRTPSASPSRDEPMLAPTEDPVADGIARARRRAVGRMLVGFLAFAAIWASVVGLASFFGWPMKHAMYLGLVGSIAYAIYRERRRRHATDVERITRRRRWRRPIEWVRRAPKRTAPADGGTSGSAASVPVRRRGPLGGHLLSNASWGEVLLWIIVVGVGITAIVAFVAYSTTGS